jgi:NAD-dependent deacetylase
MHKVTVDDRERNLERVAAMLRAARTVAVLTGAGVSAESGLATFRGADGLWEGHRVEEVASPSAFARNPELVWRFYNARRAALRNAQPNAAHRALVALEDRLGSECFTLATQNVDGLHRAAGSRNLLELHGSLAVVRCTGCGKADDRGTDPLADLPRCAACNSLLRPAVVWFEEALPEDDWQAAKRAVEQCEVFLVIGTSAVVYPAAGLVRSARDAGAKVIEVNLEPTAASRDADIGLYGPAGQILPELVRRMESS